MKNYRKFVLVLLVMLAFQLMTMTVFADGPNVGENIGKWFMQQAYWVIAIITVIAVGGCFMKRNWVGVVVSVLAGAALMALVGNIDKLKSIGEQFLQLFN